MKSTRRSITGGTPRQPKPGWLSRLIVAACLWAAVSAPATPPEQLGAAAREAASRLCALYSLAPADCQKPIDIAVVNRASEAPAYWSLPSYAAGAANAEAGRIIIISSRTGSYPYGDEVQTLRHELSHVLLYRSLGYSPPRWLDEGLAMRAAGEWGFSDDWYSALALPRVAAGRWSLDKVDKDFAGGEGAVRGSYALARGFVRDLFPNDESVTSFVLAARGAGSVEAAFRQRFGVSAQAAFSEWAKRLPWWAELLAMFTGPGALWGAVTALFLLAVLAAFRRRLRWRRHWEEEEGFEHLSGPDA